MGSKVSGRDFGETLASWRARGERKLIHRFRQRRRLAKTPAHRVREDSYEPPDGPDEEEAHAEPLRPDDHEGISLRTDEDEDEPEEDEHQSPGAMRVHLDHHVRVWGDGVQGALLGHGGPPRQLTERSGSDHIQ